MKRILFVKPPDRFLENEFVYQQLGINYLQSFLAEKGIESDLLVLYEKNRDSRIEGREHDLSVLHMLYMPLNGDDSDETFDSTIFAQYDIVGISVMTPQAPEAYELSRLLKREHPDILRVIGGSHARYYQNSVESLPDEISFDVIVPHDGWQPMLDIASGKVKRAEKPIILSDSSIKLKTLPPPTRPVELMRRYDFKIAAVPAFHTVTALGCPFSCNFCESGRETPRMFSDNMIDKDLETMAAAHKKLEMKKAQLCFLMMLA